MTDLPTVITLTMPDGTTVVYNRENDVPPIPPEPAYAMYFTANFAAFPAGHTIMSTGEWEQIFADGLAQGAEVYCLEDNTDATRHDFTLGHDPEVGSYVDLFMPQGSYGMGHRSCQVRIGKPTTPVNCSFRFQVVPASVNLFTKGGGKWGGAWQFGPIQSGPTGGIRFMGTWAGGASTFGKQDLTCSIQNQPNGGQWLQPPYYGYHPIEPGHWYSVRFRMTGGSAEDPMTVRCEYWKDSDPVMDYTAHTDNPRCKAGAEEVFWDITSFFGGTEPNAAPADAHFRIADLRIWVE
jgi:hypothetical protein